MKLANYRDGTGVHVAMVSGNRLDDVAVLPGFSSVKKVEDLLYDGRLEDLREMASGAAAGPGTEVASVRVMSPILMPEKIFCAAVNYSAHGKEGKAGIPKEPYFFTKFRNCIIGPGDPILIPKVSRKADWEAELAVIIGKKGKYIKREDALEHVAGYTIANDVSFRDFQFPEGWPEKLNSLGQNWVKGKALDSALPLGPWLVTKDEIPDTQHVGISLSVNGVLRQNSTTEDMIFGVDQIIEYLSSGITLIPGDIISTGTPAGVAAFTGVPFLKQGDVVEAKIQGIGALKNPVLEEVRD